MENDQNNILSLSQVRTQVGGSGGCTLPLEKKFRSETSKTQKEKFRPDMLAKKNARSAQIRQN